MPFLEQIVTKINTDLFVNSKPPFSIQGSRVEAIANQALVKDDGTNKIFLPLVYTSQGEWKEVTFDDTYSLTAYHRVLQNSYQYIPGDTGRDKKKQKCTTLMLMCVMALRGQIKMSKEDLEAFIVMSFPVGNTNQYLISPLQTCTLGVAETNMDSLQVFQSEFKGLDVNLNPEKIIFSVKYKIEATYLTGCFDKCACN